MLCLSSCFNKFIILLSFLLKKHFWVWGSIFFKAVFGLSFHVLCFLLPEIMGNGKEMAFNWEYVPNSLFLSCIDTSKILLDLLLTGFILLVQGQSPFHHGWLGGDDPGCWISLWIQGLVRRWKDGGGDERERRKKRGERIDEYCTIILEVNLKEGARLTTDCQSSSFVLRIWDYSA